MGVKSLSWNWSKYANSSGTFCLQDSERIYHKSQANVHCTHSGVYVASAACARTNTRNVAEQSTRSTDRSILNSREIYGLLLLLFISLSSRSSSSSTSPNVTVCHRAAEKMAVKRWVAINPPIRSERGPFYLMRLQSVRCGINTSATGCCWWWWWCHCFIGSERAGAELIQRRLTSFTADSGLTFPPCTLPTHARHHHLWNHTPSVCQLELHAEPQSVMSMI